MVVLHTHWSALKQSFIILTAVCVHVYVYVVALQMHCLASSPATVVTGIAYIGSLVPCNEINAIMISQSKWHANFHHIRKKRCFKMHWWFLQNGIPCHACQLIKEYGSWNDCLLRNNSQFTVNVSRMKSIGRLLYAQSCRGLNGSRAIVISTYWPTFTRALPQADNCELLKYPSKNRSLTRVIWQSCNEWNRDVS